MQWTGNKQKAMVKQLIMAATLFLIHNAPETIQCTQAILDLIMLAQYISYDEEIFRYMEHTLDKLEKTKITFEQHRPIDFKLCQSTFNYPKFHAISHFIQCIRDYDNVVYYDIAHNEVAHKYFLKAFYNGTNKKKYELQIWQHNMRYTNIIIIKDLIISEKAKRKKLLKGSADTTTLAEVARALSFIDFAWKYR